MRKARHDDSHGKPEQPHGTRQRHENTYEHIDPGKPLTGGEMLSAVKQVEINPVDAEQEHGQRRETETSEDDCRLVLVVRPSLAFDTKARSAQRQRLGGEVSR